MNLFKKIPFRSDGKEYEIRILYEQNIINIAPFLNNYPANGFRYQIQIPKSADITKLLDENLYLHLLDQCRDDITQNRWSVIQRVIEGEMTSFA